MSGATSDYRLMWLFNKSPLYQDKKEFSYMASKESNEVHVEGRMRPIIWYEGTKLSMEAGELSDVQNPYPGQAFANSLIADALELTERFGIFSNELQTSVEPYQWKIVLQEEILRQLRECEQVSGSTICQKKRKRRKGYSRKLG